MKHGAHQATGEPLGFPADAETRQARIRAHAAFDKLWKGGKMNRHQAYKRLRVSMGIRKDECHIGKFTKEQCGLVVDLCNSGL